MDIGKTDTELEADKMLECRKIVKNLVKFGICDKQKVQIMYLLSLEMESRDSMNIVIEAVEKIKNLNADVKFSLTDNKIDYNENKQKKLLDV
jgi:S-adenosylmethionine synthetase